MQADPTPIHLSALGTALGELSLPIDALRDEPGGADYVPLFLDDGFAHYRKTEGGAVGLITQAVQRTLQAGGLQPGSIDAVLVCAENFEEFSLDTDATGPVALRARVQVAAALARLGISGAYLAGLWSAGCANFVAGVASARGLVLQGMAEHVLVITVDCDRDLPGRIMNNGGAVYSDGASSCIVSRTVHGAHGFRIDGLALAAEVALAAIDPRRNPFGYLIGVNRAINKVKPQVMPRLGRHPGAYARILPPNLRRRSLAILAESFQLPVERFENPLKQQVAHVNAADHLLALEHELAQGSTTAGDELLLFNPGPFAWNFMGLTCVPAAARSC